MPRSMADPSEGPRPSSKPSQAGFDPQSHIGPHLWQIQWVRDLGLIAAIVFLIWFGFYLRGIFTPVLIALFFAYLFDPVITWAERRYHVRRPISAITIIILLLLVLAGVVLALGPIVVRETGQFIDNLPGYIESLAGQVKEHTSLEPGRLRASIEERLQAYRADPIGHLSQAVGWLFAGTGDVAGFIQGIIGTASYVGLMLILIPFYFFFFAWHYGPMVRGVERYIPQSHREKTLRILHRMNRVVGMYFRERLIISLIMAGMFWIGWWICGVPYALLLGLAAGVLALIPYVGIVVWPVAMLMAYLNATSGASPNGFNWLEVFIWPTLVYGVVQFMEGWILIPWIQGRSMEMSAVTILLVVFIGGAVGGLYGLILCIPIAACVKIIAVEVLVPRLAQWASEN